MKRLALAALLAINGSALVYSQNEVQDETLTLPVAVENIAPAVPQVDDATVLSDAEKSLPDSLRKVKEFQLMRELNPKDSLLEDKKVPEKRFITLGFTIGPTLSTYGLAGMDGCSAGFGPGVQVGINCDLPFGQTPVGQYFSIQPELLFSFRHTPLTLVGFVEDGGVDEDGEPTGELQKFDAADDLLYMTVPINVKASARFKKGRVFASLAPMISLGLFGNQSSDDYDNRLLFQSDPDSQQEDPIYNNFDFSLYSRLGYDCDGGLTVSLGFQLGTLDMMKASGAGVMKSRCFSLNVGYNFWGD
ncbi:MAG: PorT family protein [Paludibacteraceae bacterium]|nr:PorT family protein [Paludibacteraceae bacterium]